MPNENSVQAPKKRRGIVIILIVVLLIVAGLFAFMLWPANISRGEAQEIAIAHVGGGHANPADRDFEGFRRVWSVEVFHDGLVFEVYVAMNNGDIVRMEVDR